MFKKQLKTVFFMLVGFLAFVVNAYADGDIGVEGSIGSILNITKNADVSLQIARQPGTADYNDSMSNFTLTSPAKFTVAGDINRQVTITTAGSVSLTSGQNTANATVVCRASNSAMPTTKTDGNDCSGSNTTSADGNLYVAVFPTGVTFANEAASGTYTGTVNISINYQ